MKALFIYLYLTAMLMPCLSACTRGNSDTQVWTVASSTADCVGVGPQKCLLIKTADSDQWQFFYSQIEGFEYHEGYQYVIEISEHPVENPPADASSVRYKLERIISSAQMQSDGLPH